MLSVTLFQISGYADIETVLHMAPENVNVIHACNGNRKGGIVSRPFNLVLFRSGFASERAGLYPALSHRDRFCYAPFQVAICRAELLQRFFAVIRLLAISVRFIIYKSPRVGLFCVR